MLGWGFTLVRLEQLFHLLVLGQNGQWQMNHKNCWKERKRSIWSKNFVKLESRATKIMRWNCRILLSWNQQSFCVLISRSIYQWKSTLGFILLEMWKLCKSTLSFTQNFSIKISWKQQKNAVNSFDENVIIIRHFQ